ncbi:uncharacterized protein LOC129602095 isoform X2 [Paramacrobiotus metropolitanus]|uniref:uncharacterized protein LOC129602095 isoform X2 n=1 Tax=Paramacrobiotus metropolitanus TaxID=2943436 RepID=UPI00244633DC|nr:uncharacterized protein LOC129602095 isoform X2 [Paramacrobiotus metropolitanus]
MANTPTRTTSNINAYKSGKMRLAVRPPGKFESGSKEAFLKVMDEAYGYMKEKWTEERESERLAVRTLQKQVLERDRVISQQKSVMDTLREEKKRMMNEQQDASDSQRRIQELEARLAEEQRRVAELTARNTALLQVTESFHGAFAMYAKNREVVEKLMTRTIRFGRKTLPLLLTTRFPSRLPSLLKSIPGRLLRTPPNPRLHHAIPLRHHRNRSFQWKQSPKTWKSTRSWHPSRRCPWRTTHRPASSKMSARTWPCRPRSPPVPPRNHLVNPTSSPSPSNRPSSTAPNPSAPPRSPRSGSVSRRCPSRSSAGSVNARNPCWRPVRVRPATWSTRMRGSCAGTRARCSTTCPAAGLAAASASPVCPAGAVMRRRRTVTSRN